MFARFSRPRFSQTIMMASPGHGFINGSLIHVARLEFFRAHHRQTQTLEQPHHDLAQDSFPLVERFLVLDSSIVKESSSVASVARMTPASWSWRIFSLHGASMGYVS